METLVIVRQNNYWGAGKNLAEAKANYRRASGRNATSAADISEMEGDAEDLAKVTVDDVDGTIRGPRSIKAK